MKQTIFLLFSFLSLSCFAQDVSGLYAGTLTNDSTKKIQNYELALSEYRGKITGYSYTTFVVNDTFYYSVKRIAAIKKNGSLIVEDVKMLANNFPQRPDKGVHVTNIIPLPAQDSIINLSGKWETNKTKNFYSIHGQLDLSKENDSSHSALINHLTELGVINQPSYAQTNNKAKVENQKPGKKTGSQPAKNAVAAVVPAMERATKVLQTIEVVSDSLHLSFYDNGIVDGDTISVYLNGQNIISNQKLTEAASKKTVATNTSADSLQLTLVAESLGSIPPNTGMLVVEDGEKRYVVAFSADMQTNAAIIFRKRKNSQ